MTSIPSMLLSKSFNSCGFAVTINVVNNIGLKRTLDSYPHPGTTWAGPSAQGPSSGLLSLLHYSGTCGCCWQAAKGSSAPRAHNGLSVCVCVCVYFSGFPALSQVTTRRRMCVSCCLGGWVPGWLSVCCWPLGKDTLLLHRQLFPLCVGRCTQDTCNSFGTFGSTTQKFAARAFCITWFPLFGFALEWYCLYPPIGQLRSAGWWWPLFMMSSIRFSVSILKTRRKQSKCQALANHLFYRVLPPVLCRIKNANDGFIHIYIFFCFNFMVLTLSFHLSRPFFFLFCLKYSKDKVNDNRKILFLSLLAFRIFSFHFAVSVSFC